MLHTVTSLMHLSYSHMSDRGNCFDVGIVGAGPGGLAAAHAISKQGFSVAVFERAKELRPIGAALGLQAEGYAALEGIDKKLARRIRSLSTNPKHLSLVRPNGEVLFSDECPLYDTPFTWTAWYTLQTCLRESLSECVSLFLDHRVQSFSYNTNDPDNVNVEFKNQKSCTVKFLVGADGYNSAIRSITVGDGPPNYTGTMTWRGILPKAAAAATLPALRAHPPFHEEDRGFQMIVGERKNFWIMDSGPDLLAWTATAERASPVPSGDALRTVEAEFGRFPPLARGLVRATDPAAIVESGVFDRAPVSQWYPHTHTQIHTHTHTHIRAHIHKHTFRDSPAPDAPLL